MTFSDRSFRRLAVVLGLLTLSPVVFLLAWDAFPGLFPLRAHDVLGALPLGFIAVTYLVHQAVLRARPKDLARAILLATAFLFWAANQFWPDLPQATLFNDLAIVFFVLDVVLTMIGWPGSPPDSVIGETRG